MKPGTNRAQRVSQRLPGITYAKSAQRLDNTESARAEGADHAAIRRRLAFSRQIDEGVARLADAARARWEQESRADPEQEWFWRVYDRR